MRYITTVADANVKDQLASWVKSLRVQGWDDTVYVFSPANNMPSAPPNCKCVAVDSPYGDIDKGTALIKPEVFLHDGWSDGDQVLYMDSGDLVVLCNPNDIFDAAGGAVCAAREFSGRNLRGTIPDKVQEWSGLNRDLVWTKRLLNSGVIVGKIGPTMRNAAQEWARLCSQIPKTDGWPHYEPGDQICFNWVFRTLQKHHLTEFLPDKYNYRGGRNVRRLEIKQDHVETRNGTPVYVAHASGPGRLPHDIVRLATDSRAKRVPPEDISCTVITPAYESGWCIGRMLKSVARQTILPERVLIGIDACEDTRDAFPNCIPDAIADRVEVYYFADHQGPYMIRNTLAYKCDTDAMVFFDADDEMDELCVESQLELLGPQTIVYPLGRWQRDGDIVKSKHRAHGAFTIYTDDFHALRGFEPRLCGMDSEFWARAKNAGYRRRICEDVNYTRHKHGGNLTENPTTAPGSMIRRKMKHVIDEHRQSGYQRDRLSTAQNRRVI